MPKPSGAVWVHVKKVWYSGRLHYQNDGRGQVLAELECGHCREYKQSRAPQQRARVSCPRCSRPDMFSAGRNLTRHGVRVYAPRDPRGISSPAEALTGSG